MLVSLLVKMLHILVLCRVLLIAGVQTLTIDSQLGTSIEDCFERISIGEHLPADAIYRNVSELTNRECEHICKQDKQCQAYDYGVGAKGNATCNLSTLDEKTIKDRSPLKRHPDYDLYIRRFQCEQSPPTPIQPLSDDPGPGPQHRPVFRPEIDERPSAEDYLISGDLGYGKPPESYRPDDASNSKPDFDIGPSYGDHKPQDVPYRPGRPERPNDPYRPERPTDPYRPERPNDPYRPVRPNDPYGPERPNDPYRPERPHDPPFKPDRPYGHDRPHDQSYGPERPNDPSYGPNRPIDPYKPVQRPPSNDVLQFQGINKPKPLADEYNRPDPYKPERPDYHYIVRPTRKPRPQDYPDPYPSGPIGPPDRPYRPTNPYDKPSYSYHGQYASNYGQNTQNDNSIYVEINDPPRPYIPIKDRPNQQYNGQGYLGYGTYSSQNSYSQSQNNQYSSSITEIEGYGHKPGYKPYDERPQKPGYGATSQRPNDYEKPYETQGGYGSNQGGYGSNQGGYGSNQGGYGSNQDNYGSSQTYNTNKGSYTGNKGTYNKGDYGNQYGGNRPANDHSDYGETGYGSQTQRPNNRPNDQASYGNQNSYKGSHSSSYNEQNTQQSNFNIHASYETNRPYDQGYGKPEKPSKPYDNQDSYGSNQGYGSNHGSYVSSQGGYGSNQGGYGNDKGSHSGSSYGSNQGNYDSTYGNNQGSDGYDQSGNRPGQSGDGGYGNSQGYGSNQGGYGGSQSYNGAQSGYGFSSTTHGYGSAQSHGETQYADHSIYGGYGNRPSQKPGYGNDRPNYSNRPDYDYERPGYGQRPAYGQIPSHDQTGYGHKPIYDSQTTGYGQTPTYNDPKPGYNDPKPGYNDPKPGYNDPKPGYNDPKPGYNDPKPGYNDPKPDYNDPKPGYNDPKPGYNDPKPGYNPKPDNDKPDPPYLDVKPVYEYEMDKPNNVPAYISKPGGEVVTSRPVVIGDYGERPVYKEPGAPGQDVSYKACFRRVLAGQRALRSFVRRVASCERLEDCRRECAEERRFHCESFNYRLDPSFRGKGLCELMTKPIEAFDLRRDFVQDKDYDFYEIDRNSLEPNCPETLRGPGLLHSGFLSSKDRDDRNRPNRLDPIDRNRPNRLDGWRDRNDWVGDRGDRGDMFSYQGHKGGNRRYEDRFVPYQIGTGRTDDGQQNWGQYGGLYGGSQYYKNRNDYHKSISHWGLTSERPTYGVKPYDQGHEYRNYDHGKDQNDFDYYSLGKNLRKYFESHSRDENDFDFYSNTHKDHNKHDKIDYHGGTNFDHKKNGFDYHDFDHPLGREDGKDFSSGEDYYGVGKSLHRYGYGAWKKGRWNVSGVTNGIEEDVPKNYEASDRNDQSNAKDCFSRRRPGMSLGTGAIRRSLVARSVVACEAACFGEKEFKCVSYSYRYSNSRGSDNCFLSERTFHGLDLSADSGSDVYAMPQEQGCSAVSHTPWIESECFYHVRSDTVVSGPAAQASLTVAGLGACEAECIRAQGFFCRGFSFRFDAPTIGEELHNCILTSSPAPSLAGAAAGRAGGHELYARGNYGRGCEPHDNDVKDNGECYLQYDKAAKLTPSATRGHARVKDEQSCSNVCTEAPFKCLSFSYNNNAPSDSDNCLLSEIRLFDLQKGVDYVHSGDDWLFAFDLFNSRCWRRVHSHDQPSSEIPHPIHSSSEEDFPSGPSGTGYLPDTSGPSGPPSGPSDTYIPASGPPTGPSYHSHPEPEHKPHYPSGPDKAYPGESSRPYNPGESYPGFKPALSPGYGPPEDHKPSYRPEEPYKPGYRPEEPYKPGYRPEEPYKPVYRPEQPYRPNYRPVPPLRPPENEGYKPFRPEPRPDSRPDYRPDPRPDYRPNPRPDYRPNSRPDYRPDPRPDLPGPYKPGFRPPEPYPGKPVDSGFKPGYGSGSEGGFKPGLGDRPGYLPDRRPGQSFDKPGNTGDREGGPLEVSWRHYTVSGFPCRAGTTCAQNHIVGHWACEPEGGEIGSWDYCCAPSHRCGYSEGFHKPWCYVGPKEDQWRPCSEKYYPYHQHSEPHPSSQGHREDRPPSRPWRDTPRQPAPPRDYTPHWDQPPGPYLSPADKQYWDNLYKDGPRAYYDKYGNPLPGYSRVPTEDRPRIRNRYNPPRPGGGGTWVPVTHDDPAGVPGALGAPRYWPVAYLHKDPPPNTTYFRYNETRPTTTTERNKNERTTLPPLPPLSRELPPEPRTEKPNDLDAKSTRDDKKINISITDEIPNIDKNDTVNTTEIVPLEKEVNISEVETMKTENYKDLDRIDGIDDKLDDFSKSIEVFDIEDAKDEKSSDLKMLEAEERQIEAIGRLLAARRGTKLVIEKRSQKDLETKNIAVDKDMVEFNFGNRFPTPDRRSERRGVIKRISKDEIERDRNIDRSLEVSETTFVRPPRVLSTTENIRQAIVNGKVFYDATIREQRDIFLNSTQKPIEREEAFSTINNFREQRDIYLNSTRKPKHLRRNDDTKTNLNVTNLSNATNLSVRRAKNLRPVEDPTFTNNKNLREERDTRQNSTRKIKRRQEVSATTFLVSNVRENRDLYLNSSRKAKNLKRLEDSSTPSVIANSNFGKRKVLIPRNTNPVRRVRRVYRKRYNPEEVRKRLLERDRNKNSTESSKKI